MKLSSVKSDLLQKGVLDSRQLLSYATMSGTLQGSYFQNIVAVCFQQDRLVLYRANLDNTLGDLLLSCPYNEITGYQAKNRILYGYTEFTFAGDALRFYNYDKKVFRQGFGEGGVAEP